MYIRALWNSDNICKFIIPIIGWNDYDDEVDAYDDDQAVEEDDPKRR